MKGTVKFFDVTKGWGFITGDDKKDHFVHYSSIVMEMDGKKQLSKRDIVEFEIGNDTKGREQAVNVTPILTRKMVEDALQKENLQLKTTKDAKGNKAYMVVDANNDICAGEQGMSLEEILDWLNDSKDLLEDSIKYPCN